MFNQYPFTRLESYIAQQLGGRRCALKPFGYPFNFSTITNGAVATSTQKLNSNGFFFCTGIIAVDALAADWGDSLLQIEDQGSKENFFNSASPVSAVASIAKLGMTAWHAYEAPRRIDGNSTLLATLTAGDTSTLTTPQIYLEGVMAYVYSGQG